MVDLARKYHPLETGGILLGYVSDGGEAVVSGIIGPGPRAKHSRLRFSPDHDCQMAVLEERFRETGGQLDYLGDWHTHPDGGINLSWRDRRTLVRIGRKTKARLPCPFMLVLSLERHGWKPCSYNLTRLPSVLWRPAVIQRVPITFF